MFKYKEPLILCISVVVAIVAVAVIYCNNGFDTKATVDRVTPTKIEIIP